MEKGNNNTLKGIKDRYKQIFEVGAGTYGKVYKVASTENSNKFWAFKKITYSKDNEGFPQTALREIKILQSLNHKNVIKLHDIITSKPSENNKYKGSTFLIFDYFEHDLWGLMKKGIQFNSAQLKCIMKQMLEGVNYLHNSKIIHRDLKSANILVSNKGEVQIADFGLARSLNSVSGQYTSCVVTLWYRAPELLLGAKKYTTQVDVWSIGCIMAELILGTPIFPGDKELRQCELIFQICGTPDEKNWPGCKQLAHYNTFIPSDPSQHHERTLKNHMLKLKPFLDSVTLDFLDRLLTLNPEKRLTCQTALEHEYFHTNPLPCDPKDLPKVTEECHITLMSMEKKKREMIKQKEEEEKALRKRRYGEVDSRKSFGGQPPPPERPMKSPEVDHDPYSYLNRSSFYGSENKPKPPAMSNPMVEEKKEESEPTYGGISSLFAQITQDEKLFSEKKEGFLESLLQQSSQSKKPTASQTNSSSKNNTDLNSAEDKVKKKIHI